MARKWDAAVASTIYKEDDWVSPTKIAKLVRNQRGVHSAWASPICLRLVKEGVLWRNEKGHYRARRGEALRQLLDTLNEQEEL